MINNKLTINVKIIDRLYPIRINREDEELIRKAADEINETVSKYKSNYADKDNQDFLSMVCINYVVKFLQNKNKYEADNFAEDLKEIEAKLAEITN